MWDADKILILGVHDVITELPQPSIVYSLITPSFNHGGWNITGTK